MKRLLFTGIWTALAFICPLANELTIDFFSVQPRVSAFSRTTWQHGLLERIHYAHYGLVIVLALWGWERWHLWQDRIVMFVMLIFSVLLLEAFSLYEFPL